MTYGAFLDGKRHFGEDHGFAPVWMPAFLFDFQSHLVDWAVRKGRAAIFADCGLGKTPMQLVWAENVVRRTNRPVLVLTPLAVGGQTVREAAKFGLEAVRSRDGSFPAGARIIVTNYEQLEKFDAADFSGVVCDESAILKNFDGVRRAQVTEFMRTRPYRLLCTATAAPNDYVELGTSSEALGGLGHMDMLGRFFKANDGSLHPHRRAYLGAWVGEKWRFRGHSERDFWRWVCSWARAVRRPSDLGFEDGRFQLPPLETVEHVIHANLRREGYLFDLPAKGLSEQREERRRTLRERCEKVSALVAGRSDPCVVWCHLNPEGDLLADLIPGSVQVSGSDSDEAKEEAFTSFQDGEIRVLVTKPTIAGYGLNWQHCAHQTFFPSHSFEQWYQSIRRSWRFGQSRPVRVDVVTSEGEMGVLANLQRKSAAADVMFSRLVEHMNDELDINRVNPFTKQAEVPSWLL